MVQVYEQLKAKFTVDDYSHYLFTPRDLTNWVLGLLRYELAGGGNDNTHEHVLECWVYEACRLFRDRLVGSDSCTKFDDIIMTVIRTDWSGNVFDKLNGKLMFSMEVKYFIWNN